MYPVLAEAFRLTTTQVAIVAPIGVLGAAVISLLALRWSTKANIANAQLTLDKTLAAQQHTTELTLDQQRKTHRESLEAQRQRSADERLFERRDTTYVAQIAAIDAFMQTVSDLESRRDDGGKFAEIAALFTKDGESPLFKYRNQVLSYGDKPVRDAFESFEDSVYVMRSGAWDAEEAWNGTMYEARPEGMSDADWLDRVEPRSDIRETLGIMSDAASEFMEAMRRELRGEGSSLAV